jgi:hypothetical protein
MTLAFITVYAPVWVDEFGMTMLSCVSYSFYWSCVYLVLRAAPRDRQTSWMAWLQISIPLGVMLGYAAGILTTNYVPGLGMWRIPFIIQVRVF